MAGSQRFLVPRVTYLLAITPFAVRGLYRMPSDEYASVGGGGALRLKGGKVKKHKKKKDKGSDLEKNLSTGESSKEIELKKPRAEEVEDDDEARVKSGEEAEEQEDDTSKNRKTEAERRFEEARRKKVRFEQWLPSDTSLITASPT